MLKEKWQRWENVLYCCDEHTEHITKLVMLGRSLTCPRCGKYWLTHKKKGYRLHAL